MKTLTRSMECVLVCFSYLTQLAVLHLEPQALSVGQRVASLGRGGLAGRRRRAVAHGPPSRYHHLAAGLVLIQCTLTSINHPETGYKEVWLCILALTITFSVYSQFFWHSFFQLTDCTRCVFPVRQLWSGTILNGGPTSDAICRMKRYRSLSWSLRFTAGSQRLVWAAAWGFLSAHPVKWRVLYVSFSRWRSNASAHLCYCSAGSVLTHWDTCFLVN